MNYTNQLGPLSLEIDQVLRKFDHSKVLNLSILSFLMSTSLINIPTLLSKFSPAKTIE